MVTTTVDVIGPLAFIVVLELAQLARKVPVADPGGGTERIDYETAANRRERVVRGIAERLGYSQAIVSAGGFLVVFQITELVLYAAILSVYSSGGPILLVESGIPLTRVGVLLFLAILWIALPVVVVDRYDDLTDAGVEPFSVNVHVATTVLYLLLVATLVEARALGPVARVLESHPVPATLAGGVIVGLFGAAIAGKSRSFYEFLRAELARIEPDAGETDPG